MGDEKPNDAPQKNESEAALEMIQKLAVEFFARTADDKIAAAEMHTWDDVVIMQLKNGKDVDQAIQDANVVLEARTKKFFPEVADPIEPTS